MYLSKDDLKSLELIHREVNDEELKEKLIKLYISDIRKEHDLHRRHKHISLDSSGENQLTKIEYELSRDIADSNVLAMQKIENEELYDAINQLTETERLIMQLFFYWELTSADIGKIIGVSQQAVSERKLRILKKLKKVIKK